MIKIKKQNTQLPLVVTGYILFSLLLLTTLISTTIPFTTLLFSPIVIHANVLLTLVALTVGALLPVLLGYIIGGQSIKTKNNLSHHFTGVLFGLLAYWIMVLLSVFITIPSEVSETNHTTGLVVVNILPSIGVALIAAALSIAHMRSRQAKKPILEYKPFSTLLITLVVALPLWSIIHNTLTNTVNAYSFVSLILVIIVGFISYLTLRRSKLSSYSKIVWSAVSVSVLFAVTFVLPQLVSTISMYLLPASTADTQTLINEVAFILSLLGWSAYWIKQVKALR